MQAVMRRAIEITNVLPSCVIHFIAVRRVVVPCREPHEATDLSATGEAGVAVDHVENDPGEHGDHEQNEQTCGQQETSAGRFSVHPLVKEPHQYEDGATTNEAGLVRA